MSLCEPCTLEQVLKCIGGQRDGPICVIHSLLMHCASKGLHCDYVQNKHREHAHTHVCVRASASEFVCMLVHIWHIIQYLWKCTIIPQVAVIREAIIDIT